MTGKIHFSKMHGLGNDFMLIDGTQQSFVPDGDKIRQWANRHTGIGFDQLLLVEMSDKADCDFKYRIFNCDGSEVEQCGNGARCFAKYVYHKGLTTKKKITVETKQAIIVLKIKDNDLVEVDMGAPKLALADIPFIPSDDDKKNGLTQSVVVDGGISFSMVCVNMGNPHAVMIVQDIDDKLVHLFGESIERSPQFPNKTNVEFMQVLDRAHIKLRVHERGVGETLACGSGACAAVVAGVKLGILDNEVMVSLLGGDLLISWTEGNNVLMLGPAEFVYDGVIESA